MPVSCELTVVPASPAMIRPRSASAPIAAVFPVACGEPARRCHLRPHRSGGERHRRQRGRRRAPDRLLRRLAPVDVDRVGVGQHHEQVGVELARQQLGGEVLVDHALDAGQLAGCAPGSYIVGMPPPPAAITIVLCSSSHLIGRSSKMRFGSGDGDDAPPLVAVLLEDPALLARRGDRLRPWRRPVR